MGKKLLAGSFIVAVVLVFVEYYNTKVRSASSFTGSSGSIPPPSMLTALTVVYLILGGIELVSPSLAAAFAIAVDMELALKVAAGVGPGIPGITSQVGPGISGITGKSGSGSTGNGSGPGPTGHTSFGGAKHGQ